MGGDIALSAAAELFAWRHWTNAIHVGRSVRHGTRPAADGQTAGSADSAATATEIIAGLFAEAERRRNLSDHGIGLMRETDTVFLQTVGRFIQAQVQLAVIPLAQTIAEQAAEISRLKEKQDKEFGQLSTAGNIINHRLDKLYNATDDWERVARMIDQAIHDLPAPTNGKDGNDGKEGPPGPQGTMRRCRDVTAPMVPKCSMRSLIATVI